MPPASPTTLESESATAAAATLTADRQPRVLLIRRRYLGDIVLLGSVLRNLRAH